MLRKLFRLISLEWFTPTWLYKAKPFLYLLSGLYCLSIDNGFISALTLFAAFSLVLAARRGLVNI